MKRTPSLIIKDAIKQQKLMVYLLKLAALDNQCLKIPRNPDIQERYDDWTVLFIRLSAVILIPDNSKLTYDVYSLISQEQVPEKMAASFLLTVQKLA